jgi:hypothetical protein
MPKTYIELLVNDEPREFLAAPGATLLSALREDLGPPPPSAAARRARAGPAPASSTARRS